MIQEYRFGKMKIGGQTYTYDVEVRWGGEILDWQREESHIIDVKDIERALEQNPEVLVIGTGKSGIAQVTDKAQEAIARQEVKLIIDKTGEAVKTFNVIKEESEEEEGVQARVIGLFHLTC